ncbi:DNA topoisomerase [Cryptosporidium andersoni]|uniref:DNA topoisomerase (ATP-hydrolyzing) n=1 Tax=Cryptosporidium andersoni TaxID=117008 RepID=A0A1J4MQM2_9CRYT|nr:DNA topoisomerase [Cryptosporidium andersoni]
MEYLEDLVLQSIGQLTDININPWLHNISKNNEIISNKNSITLRYIAKVICVANTLHNVIQQGRRMSLRELYYHNTWLFDNQNQATVIVRKISIMLRIPRSTLGLFPSPKGMIGGRITFRYKDIEVLNIDNMGITGAIIGDNFEDIGEQNNIEVESDAQYIIVIEKASIFQYLMERKISDRFSCILITGKGFPDIATRKLISYLVYKLKITTLYLGDYDPPGINIYLTYVRGSDNYESLIVACPHIYFMGIHYEDTFDLPCTTQIPLTRNDKTVLSNLLSDPVVKACNKLHGQCKMMFKSGYKCELEAFQAISSDFLVNSYLPNKLLKRSWI